MTGMVVLANIGVMIMAIFPLREFVGRENFPCLLGELIPFVVVGLVGCPMALRGLHYHWRIELNRQLASSAFAKSAAEVEQVGEAVKAAGGDRYRQALVDLKTLRLLASKKFVYFLQFVLTISFVVAAFILTGDRLSCSGCEQNPNSFYAQVFFILVMLSVALAGLYLVRNEPDPLEIVTELKLVYIIGPLGLILNLVLDGAAKKIEDEGRVFWNYILVITLWICQWVLVIVQVKKGERWGSGERKKSDVRKNSELDELLHSDVGKQYFKSHLANELCIENYFFWRDVKAFKEKGGTKEEAEQIFAIYIARNSVLEINISSALFTAIQDKINRDTIDPSIFDEAYTEIVHLMSTNSLPRFKQSKEYHTLMNEESSPNLEIGI